MKGINWVGVLAALVASQAIGFVWYGVVFEDTWVALSGVNPDASSNAAMIWGAVQNLVVAIGLAWLTARTGMTGWVGGAMAGMAACAFFALATLSLRFIYGGDNGGLIPIDGGYMLVQYAISGALVGGLRFGRAATATA